MRKHYTHTYHYLIKAMLLLVVSACGLVCSAQGLIIKNIRADRPSMMFGSVIAEGNTYVVSGVTTNPTSPHYPRSVIGRMDEQGNFITTSYLYDGQNKEYGTFTNSLIRTQNNRYVYTGYTTDSDQHVLWASSNASFDSVVLVEHDSSNSFAYKGYYLTEYEYGFYIAGARTDKNIANPDLLLMKVDQSGSKVWQKLYGNVPNWEGASSLIKLSNGNLMIGSFRRDLETPIETANTWLLEVDTAGTIVRQWFDDNDSTLGAYSLKQTSDGGFIYGAENIYTQSINGPSFIGSVVKLDSNFNIQWKWTGGNARYETGIYDIEELPDGNFIACGNNPYFDGTVIIGAWVVKLSSSGELLWQRHYSGSNEQGTENYLNDIDVLPNGNLVAVGETRDFTDVNRGQMGLLIVMDTNGCVIENCVVGIDDIAPQTSINVYPNPFIAVLNISMEHVTLNDAVITVTNPLGQVVYTQKANSLSNNYTLDLHHLSAGVYYISVAANGERVVRSIVKD